MTHPWIVGLLLAACVALCVACALGVFVMRDAYQRLHFTTPVAAVVSTLVAVAVFVGDASPQSRTKATMIAVILTSMNAVLCHVTARALRLRDVGHWPVAADEPIVSSESGAAS